VDAPTPGSHLDPWLALLGGYVTETVEALSSHGILVDRSWLDPYDPRDATIVLANSRALVFDEVSGWRHGVFLGGRPRRRTALADVEYLGGGVLPAPEELAQRLLAERSEGRRDYRSYSDIHDGFDDALRGYDTNR
jgi:hypothetical protein